MDGSHCVLCRVIPQPPANSWCKTLKSSLAKVAANKEFEYLPENLRKACPEPVAGLLHEKPANRPNCPLSFECGGFFCPNSSDLISFHISTDWQRLQVETARYF